MLNKKYKVLRSRIYLGEVISPNVINYLENYSEVVEYTPIRYSLFELDDNNRSNDLLNKVPNYLIADYTTDIERKELCIIHPVYLGKLLEYLGIEEVLDYKDILYIRNLLFNGEFAKNNPNIFGRLNQSDEFYIDSYYYKLFDSLGKNKLIEIINHSKETIDPFKISVTEMKKKLVP